MSIQYQSLLGDASIDADTIITSELDATDANVSNLNATITTTGTLKLPTTAALNNVLTCVNLNGTAAWRPPVDVNLAGDAVGIAAGNRVDTLAGGTIAVSNLVTLNGNQTLTNKTLGNFTVSGVETLQKSMWFDNTGQTKLLALWDSGNINDQTQHNFYGFGIGSSTLRYQVGSTAGAHVFYSSLTAATSNELFRIGGNGLVTIPGTLKLPTGAAIGRILTSDAEGSASWITPSVITSLTMGGDCAGTTDNCIVVKASGVFTIASTMVSNNVFGMTLQATNGTFGRTQMILNNSTTTNGLLLDNSTGTMQGVDFDMKMGLYSMKNRYELRSAFMKNSSNAADGENQISILGNDVAYFGKVSSGINGYLYAQSGVWAPYIVMPTADVRKRIVLFEGGSEFNQDDHRFTGFGKIPSALLISSQNAADDVVFSSATSSTTSTETLRVKGTGGIVLPSVGAILPKQVFNHYEEYLHTTAFLGPVITDLYNTRIVRTGKVVVLYVANNIAATTVTGGVIGWDMGNLLPTRFRPGSDVNCLLKGKQSNASAIINCVVTSTGQVGLSVALGGTWSGNIGFNTFSITWTL